MSEHIPSFYVRLGLGLDADVRAVKRAYARILKTIDPDLQATEFEKLRSDYDQALDYVQNPDREHYFDDEEFFFKATIDQDLSADSINNIDFSEKNEKDSASIVEDVNQNAKLSSYEVAKSEFQEFCKSIGNTNIPKLTNSELAEFLGNFLLRQALIAFEVRIRFENLLIEALAHRHFGQNSGRLLISSAAFFNWNTADSRRLTDCGAAGQDVRFLLDSFFGLTDIAQLNLLRISESPDSEFAFLAVSKLEEYKLFSSQLYGYFVADEHEKAWFKSKQNAPFLQKLNERFKSIEKHITIQHGYWLFLLVWLIYKFTK